MNLENKRTTPISGEEADDIGRKLLSWFNQNAALPDGVKRINYIYLEDDKPGMMLSPIQGAYKIEQDITGNYTAQYQFELMYRSQPTNNGERMSMDQELNSLADWAASQEQKPDLGAGISSIEINRATIAAFFNRYENGDEDHHILMVMVYTGTE